MTPTAMPDGAVMIDGEEAARSVLTFLTTVAAQPLTPEQQDDVVAAGSLVLRRLAVFEGL